MPVTRKFYSVPSADHNWFDLTAGSICQLIDAELKAWVAACNLNVGNTNKQITIIDDVNISTGSAVGWNLKFEINATDAIIVQSIADFPSGPSTTGWEFEAADFSNFTPGTVNDGYGSIASPIANGAVEFDSTTGSNGSYIVAYSSDPLEEFFIFGWSQSFSSSYSHCWGFAKDQNDNWAILHSDGTSGRGLFVINESPFELQQYSVRMYNSSALATRINYSPSSSSVNFPTGTETGDSVNFIFYVNTPHLWTIYLINFGQTYNTADYGVIYGVCPYIGVSA